MDHDRAIHPWTESCLSQTLKDDLTLATWQCWREEALGTGNNEIKETGVKG